MEPVYIAIGSNLGERAANLVRARSAIDALDDVTVTGSSDVYETEPVGPVDQGPYLNAVVSAACSCEPEALMHSLLSIERDMGRVRGEKWGPRVIDLDMLLFSDRVIEMPALIVPHPRIAERRFVLQPLCDLNRDLVLPGQATGVRELRDAAPPMRVERIDVADW